MVSHRFTGRKRPAKLAVRSGVHAAAAAGLLIACLQFAAAQQQPEQSAPQPAAAKPGMLESIGRFFEQGAANFRASVQGTKQKIDDFNDQAFATGKNFGNAATEASKNAANATKGAVEAVVKLPMNRVVTGRERCEAAANGAPDCQAAAETLCRKQGYASGKSIDFTSAEQCPPRAWLSRQGGGECTTVTFINRAMCQ